MPVSDYAPIFDAAGQEWNVDPNLLRAMAQQESGGKPRIVSSAGAQGVMQIMPGTQRDLGVTDPNDPQQSIFGGAKYMSQLLDQYKSPELALAAYNAGPDRVDNHLATGNPLPRETQAYVPAISANYQRMAKAPAASAAPAATSAAPAVQPASDEASRNAAFLSRSGATTAAAPPTPDSGPSPAATPDYSDFLTRTGATPAAAPASRPMADKFGPLAGDAANANLEARQAIADKQPVNQAIRDAIAPAPNTTYGDVLPIAQDNATGAYRMALPGSARNLLTGAMDLAEGPTTGTVTPAGTNALANVMMGGGINPSPASGTGAAIGNRLYGAGRNETPDLLGAQFRASPQLQAPAPPPAAIAPPNSMPILGQVAPAAPTMAFPSGPQVAAPANDLAAAVNRGAASPIESQATAMPPASVIPITTQAGADARAQAIIDHFSQGGANTHAASPIEGVGRTYAQSTNNPGVAALENGLRSSDPNFNNMYNQKMAANAGKRLDAVQGVIGAPEDIDAAEAARDAATGTARDAAFANTKPVDAQPVVDQINGILASPDGKRDAVVRSLNPILAKLQTSDGSALESDAGQLYGVRKAINDALAAKGTQEGSDAAAATRQMVQVKNTLDGVIESGSPGFGDYIKTYSDMSRPIDEMRYLQGRNLTNSRGELQLSNLDSTIKAIQSQQNLPGARQADSVSPEKLAQLQALRTDMARQTSLDATKPLGSNTTQTLATNALTQSMAGGMASGGLAGGLAGAAALGVVHPAALSVFAARYGLGKMNAKAEMMVRNSLTNKLLNPPTTP